MAGSRPVSRGELVSFVLWAARDWLGSIRLCSLVARAAAARCDVAFRAQECARHTCAGHMSEGGTPLRQAQGRLSRPPARRRRYKLNAQSTDA